MTAEELAEILSNCSQYDDVRFLLGDERVYVHEVYKDRFDGTCVIELSLTKSDDE